MLQHLLNKQMLAICVIIAVAVFLAILIDLICGLHKAKQRGEKRNSFALSRTITKFREMESVIFFGDNDICLQWFSLCKGILI